PSRGRPEREALMSAKLVVSAGPDEGKVFPLPEGATFTIGRGDTASIRLADPTISRAHCVIDFFGGRVLLKDNASKSGTRVNGTNVSQHELRADEVINIGSTRLRFQRLAPPRPAPAEAAEGSAELGELRSLSGTRLGHFEIGAVVGVGSSGVVFRAH